MAPLPPSPRVVVYYQTHFTRDSQVPISVLPLLGREESGGRPSATHIVVAALHVNNSADNPDNHLTLNDHPPSHPRFSTLWSELAIAQAKGVYVLALLGGAAKGSYERLDISRVDQATFEHNYAVVYSLLKERRLDGIDLDVEEPMSLEGIVHLIDRLRADFGPRFLITMAPVAAALLRPYDPRCNLSGFSYADVERQRGAQIAWYHAQFYCGWGDAGQPHMYASMVGLGPGDSGPGLGGTGGPAVPGSGASLPIVWPAHRVVMGLVTSPANGPGFVSLDTSAEVMMQLQAATAAAPMAFPSVPGMSGGPFAGVSGWEYFNSMPGGEDRPWEWAEWMSAILGSRVPDDGQAGNLQVLNEAPTSSTVSSAIPTPASSSIATTAASTTGFDIDAGGLDAPVPEGFEYNSETEE
ncbi:glycoside hydrolase family 18 protein [Ophiostoma piceae UAMH 11346]|uniref:Glycoside hydrolase family 18 protein n=1 Tax=Ophiostoma piceae (strain UAMH 11346) TaxID=1262450 RepID=S3C6L7_OPHP1|nr:glycoside hydrolase family 18 protein [Ophiostoma piceae UAMH 11346]